MTKETLEEAAERWVFETNGQKWSNNDDTAGDNYGSFIAGYKLAQEKLCDSEVLQRIRASKSDAEARRIIRTI
jgi:hypothetical protein